MWLGDISSTFVGVSLRADPSALCPFYSNHIPFQDSPQITAIQWSHRHLLTADYRALRLLTMLKSLSGLSLDVRLLLVSVFLRRASFGLTNQVLALFLEAAGISKSKVGFFMTLTLVGDTVISYVLTWYSDWIGRRVVMMLGCLLMFASGLVFAYCLNFWILLAAAILGVISTSGDETGPFKTVEEASLSHLSAPKTRTHTFALYGFLGTMGSAVGAFFCGFLVDHLSLHLSWPEEKCYRAVFIVYAGLAIAKFLLAFCLSSACEVSEEELENGSLDPTHVDHDAAPQEDTEQRSLLPSSNSKSAFTRDTKRILPRLLVVFMLDSFGYGFMPPAWIVYYFKSVFNVSASALGSLFFFTNLVDSVSSIVSAVTFHYLGPIKAILAAQLPSAVFFFSIPFASSFSVSGVLYFLFCACGTMDVVPRQIFLTTVIPKRDLIRVMGTVNIVKTFARCIGPIFTGKLAQHNLLQYGFYINGLCLFVADTILGTSFVHLDAEVLQLHRN